MTRFRGPEAALVAVLAVAAAPIPAIAQSQATKVYSVSDVGQFLEAVGPDRVVVLRKGDYQLSAAYSFSSDYVSWTEGDDGKELSLSGLENLTIRGSDGARVVSGSSLSSIIGVYDSSGVTIDNIVFARTASAGGEAGAGSLYAEAVDGLAIDRCSFEGGTTVAVELWECSDVRIRRSSISGAISGALSACYTDGIDSSSLSVSGCEGYPLFYFEDCGDASFADSSFEGNSGGSFVEVYGVDQEAGSVTFASCSFAGNDFEYFVGSSSLPATEDCEFDGNSFGEDWADNSVAASDEDYYGEDWWSDEDYEDYDEYAAFSHPSGLSFEYPSYWELLEYGSKSRYGLFSPDGSALVLVMTPYAMPASADPARQRDRILADALAALTKILKAEASISISAKKDGEPFESGGLVAQEYRGEATKGKGERAALRVRLVIYRDGVHAVVGVAKDASSLDVDTDADYVFSSVMIGKDASE